MRFASDGGPTSPPVSAKPNFVLPKKPAPAQQQPPVKKTGVSGQAEVPAPRPQQVHKQKTTTQVIT